MAKMPMGRSFETNGRATHRPKAVNGLEWARVRKVELDGLLHIANVDRASFQKRPTGRGAWRERQPGEVVERIVVLALDQAALATIGNTRREQAVAFTKLKDRAALGVAEPGRRVDDRLEHRAEVGWRGGDDPEHFGGGDLLLQRIG
jgi:hypothetical protein